jgi:DNA-binding CsgD family transcriptional regulator
MTLTHPAGQMELVNHPGLSMRENCILLLRMKGISLKDIGNQKGFRYWTGYQHTKHIRQKTNSSSMRLAAALILQLTMEKNQNETEV